MSLRPELCSVHTHSVMCDGENTLEEMAGAAFEAGVRYFGASGHSHTPVPYDEGNVLAADLTAYLSALSALRQKYSGKMEILFGMEWDSCSEGEPPDGLDYYIGSVHNLRDEKTGRYYSVDWTKQQLSKCCREMFGGDFAALIRHYYADVAATAQKRPDILGHFDLVTKLNGDGGFFDEESPQYKSAARDALHAADPHSSLLEINTGAVYRGYRKAPYPALFLLMEWKDMGGSIIISSDAHSAGGIIFGYTDAAELARAAGFDESVLLTLSGRTVCQL